VVDSNGRSGGIWLLWKLDLVETTILASPESGCSHAMIMLIGSALQFMLVLIRGTESFFGQLCLRPVKPIAYLGLFLATLTRWFPKHGGAPVSSAS
jgi:hypothetical protein